MLYLRCIRVAPHVASVLQLRRMQSNRPSIPGLSRGDENSSLNAKNMVSRGEVSEMLVGFVGVAAGRIAKGTGQFSTGPLMFDW